MSSIETRTNKRTGRTVYRVRFRHGGSNKAVTFVTESGAQAWRQVLDQQGYEIASLAFPTGSADLSDFEGQIVPRSGQRHDPFGCFVYFLWADDVKRPVYIGATTNLPKRIWDHCREKNGLWTTYSLIRCSSSDVMFRVEARLISHFRPELNIKEGHAA